MKAIQRICKENREFQKYLSDVMWKDKALISYYINSDSLKIETKEEVFEAYKIVKKRFWLKEKRYTAITLFDKE